MATIAYLSMIGVSLCVHHPFDELFEWICHLTIDISPFFHVVVLLAWISKISSVRMTASGQATSTEQDRASDSRDQYSAEFARVLLVIVMSFSRLSNNTFRYLKTSLLLMVWCPTRYISVLIGLFLERFSFCPVHQLRHNHSNNIGETNHFCSLR